MILSLEMKLKMLLFIDDIDFLANMFKLTILILNLL
jgi:hypothetical protein